MKPRRRSGHDYSNRLCLRPTCMNCAPHGYRGYCEKHARALRQLHGYVNAEPVAKHIVALKATGVSIPEIALLSGVSKMTVYRITGQKSVSADTAARIMRLAA